jgi:hypothetical protein
MAMYPSLVENNCWVGDVMDTFAHVKLTQFLDGRVLSLWNHYVGIGMNFREAIFY